jgi:hypothetical protein
MGRRAQGGAGDLASEAARILVEEQLTDYGLAKRRAAERLGLSSRSALPDNARVEAEVLAYQRLFGGRAYAERLRLLRQTAVQAMKLLAGFEPRLSGAVVSGAISAAHRVQLHCFPDQPELVDVFLAERGFTVDDDERDYRYGDGRVESVPLARFQAGVVGVDVALFAPGQERRAPLSHSNGRPAPRLTLAEAERLLATAVETLY